MSMDEIHWCWEQCCDMGPHSCICGNDCKPLHREPYTPTTDEVRAVWREWNGYGGLIDRVEPEPTSREAMVAEFDRWLAGVRAEARAKALREAADEADSWTHCHWYTADAIDWLRALADGRGNEYGGYINPAAKRGQS